MPKPSKTPIRRGRPLGSRNKRTVERIKATAKAIAEVRKDLTDAEINALTPLETMLMAMRASVISGDLVAALAAARDAAPYVHAKVQAIAPDAHMPAELLADPPSRPDEPGPENPIL